MSSYVSAGVTFVSNNASWLHSYIKQIPHAGTLYAWTTANVGSPILNLICKIRDFVMTYFLSPVGRFVWNTARNNPWASRFIRVMLAVFTIRAIVHCLQSNKKEKAE